MKRVLLSYLIALLVGSAAFAEPVPTTSLEEALRAAPLIMVAEAGAREYDDLKEGQEVKTSAIAFESRKQSFKILKIYRNTTTHKLKEGALIDVNHKTNSCLEFPIIVKKVGAKLQVIQVDRDSGRETRTIDVDNSHAKEVLFLAPAESDPKFLEDYGWFVSPQKFTADLENKLKSVVSNK